MKKKTQITLVVVLVMAVIICLVWLYWYLAYPLFDFSTPPSSTPSPQETEPLNPHLTMSKKIIDQVGQETEENGSYGGYADCDYQDGEYLCEAKRLPYSFSHNSDLVPYGDFSYVTAQMWARSKYYIATGDQAELEKLQQDVDYLNERILNGPWVLATSRFHCLFLHDIANANILDKYYTKRLVDSCNYDYHQVYPDSIISFNQNAGNTRHNSNDGKPHHIRAYDDYQNNVIRPPFEWGQVYNNNIIVPDGGAIVADKDEEIDATNDYLNQIIAGQPPAIANSSLLMSIEDIEWYEKFIRRNVIATIDYLAKNQLNYYFHPENDEGWQVSVLLDYLGLTRELLAYYYTYPELFDNTDTCLLATNMTYYLDMFTDFTTEEKSQILALLAYTDSIDPTFNHCRLARQYLLHETIDSDTLYQDISDFNKEVGTQNWKTGYLYPTDYYEAEYPVLSTDTIHQYRFRYDINAIVAGLLTNKE